MPISKAQQKAVNKYRKNNYDLIQLTVPLGEKDVIKAHAESRGESVNAFLRRSIHETMERDPFTDSRLDNAVWLIANAVGESKDQLISEIVRDNLCHVLEGIVIAKYNMVDGYSKEQLCTLNRIVKEAGGKSADEWLLDQESLSSDAKKAIDETIERDGA